ncbi:hypothetical protein GCM10027074_72810 [Streptomyces deserti]
MTELARLMMPEPTISARASVGGDAVVVLVIALSRPFRCGTCPGGPAGVARHLVLGEESCVPVGAARPMEEGRPCRVAPGCDTARKPAN